MSQVINKPKPSEDCFWGLSGQIVKAIEPYSESDPMALLNQLLNAFGSIVGKGPHFLAEADKHGANLFTINVGNSSKGRKGTSWGQIYRLLELVDPDWCSEKIKSGIGSGEALVFMLRDGDYLDPFVKTNDKKILIMESEFGSLLRVINREGNITSPVLRNAWDGKPLENITKVLELRATGHHVSLIGHITKTELLLLLRESDVFNGLANRCLFFYTERSKFLPNGGSLPEASRKHFAHELKQAVTFSRKLSVVRRSSHAEEFWANIYPKLSSGDHGIVGVMSSRSEAQVMRLALIIAMMNKSEEITLSALKAALAIHDYTVQSLKLLFGNRTGFPLADKIYDFLISNPDGVSRTQIRDLFNKNSTGQVIGEALQILAESNLAEKFEIKTNGRPIEMWKSRKIQ